MAVLDFFVKPVHLEDLSMPAIMKVKQEGKSWLVNIFMNKAYPVLFESIELRVEFSRAVHSMMFSSSIPCTSIASSTVVWSFPPTLPGSPIFLSLTPTEFSLSLVSFCLSFTLSSSYSHRAALSVSNMCSQALSLSSLYKP